MRWKHASNGYWSLLSTPQRTWLQKLQDHHLSQTVDCWRCCYCCWQGQNNVACHERGVGRIWRGAPHGFHALLQPAGPAGSGIPAQMSGRGIPWLLLTLLAVGVVGLLRGPLDCCGLLPHRMAAVPWPVHMLAAVRAFLAFSLVAFDAKMTSCSLKCWVGCLWRRVLMKAAWFAVTAAGWLLRIGPLKGPKNGVR